MVQPGPGVIVTAAGTTANGFAGDGGLAGHHSEAQDVERSTLLVLVLVVHHEQSKPIRLL